MVKLIGKEPKKGELKAAGVNIIDFSIMQGMTAAGQMSNVVIGLGDDSLMYVWHKEDQGWRRLLN